MIIKDIPYELKIRFSELEKAIMNMKALRVGESVRAKIIGKEGKEYLLDFKGFRMKANINFDVKVGEELNLIVKETGENIKFELEQPKITDKVKSDIVRIVIKTGELSSKLESVFKDLAELLQSDKVPDKIKNTIIDEIMLKLDDANILKTIEQDVSLFTESGKESSIAKIFKFLISTSDSENLSEPELLNQIKDIIENQQNKIKNILKEQKNDLESFKTQLFKSIESEKGSQKIKNVLNDFFKAVENIRNHNLSVKEHGITNQNLTMISFIVPIFAENKTMPDYLKMEYKKNRKSKSYNLKTVSLMLNMSRLGKIKIELRKVGKILRVDFVSNKNDVLDILKTKSENLRKKILGYFENVFFEYRSSKKELESFFEEGFGIEGSSLDIKV